ncbi:MAG: MATE family efflux transporter [Hyphomicrobiaceae bacterium]|nr:MATE family efflux transporter [Hyphomicrobiaceae bacterium]MCC0022590.1 MATE family efflux transporter [Hyphomicrobiaceae bacterium]
MSAPVYPFEVRHRDVWTIALPATFAFVTEPLAGLVDLTLVGRLGDAALLGGLVLGVLVFDFLFSITFFVRLGTAGLVAQAVGARDEDKALTHLVRALLFGTALGLLAILLAPLINWVSLALIAPQPDVLPAFEDYFGVRIWSGPMVLINFALLGWFYGRAEATTGLLLQVVVHVGNMVLSALFVFGLGCGVAGVALGTVIAQTIAAILGLWLVAQRYGGVAAIYQRVPNHVLLDLAGIRRMLSLSRDLMIRSIALMSAFAFFTAQTARMGTLELSANAIVLNFLMITAFLLDGQAQAAEQISGKAIGANYKPAFLRAMKLAHFWGYVISGLLFVFWLVAGPWMIELMTTADDVRQQARIYVPVAALTALTGVMPFVMDGITIGATLNTILRNGMVVALIVFLTLAMILQPLFGIMGLWAALHLWFVTRGLVFLFAVWRKIPKLFPAG